MNLLGKRIHPHEGRRQNNPRKMPHQFLFLPFVTYLLRTHFLTLLAINKQITAQNDRVRKYEALTKIETHRIELKHIDRATQRNNISTRKQSFILAP